MIHVEGNLNVQNYHDQSVTLAAQTNTQTNTQVNVQPQVGVANTVKSSNPVNGTKIKFNKRKGNRVNIFRVIEAMRVHGFFLDEQGGPAKQADVFAAFGLMLGEDFSDYTKDLSQGKVHNAGSTVSGDIFDTLKQEFLESISE